MSASRPRTMAPRSVARSACAPPIVAARSASSMLMPKYETAIDMTSAIDVMPVPPAVWSVPSATVTPLSSSDLTGGLAWTCSAVPGHTTAVTPALASAPTSSSSAWCSRSADTQPAAAAGGQDDPCLLLGEAAFLAVHVDAVRAHGLRVGTPGADRVDVVRAPPEVLRRHRVRGQERHVDP